MRGKLVGLQQREHFPELVHGAEAAGKNDQGFGHLREPELAHEEVMEAEIQLGRDVGVRTLLVRKLNAEADRASTRFGRAAVGGLHDPRAAARADYKAPG